MRGAGIQDQPDGGRYRVLGRGVLIARRGTCHLERRTDGMVHPCRLHLADYARDHVAGGVDGAGSAARGLTQGQGRIRRKRMTKPRNWSKGRYAHIVHQLTKQLREGRAWEAVIYRDFHCTPHSFMSQLYALAKAHGYKVSCAS